MISVNGPLKIYFFHKRRLKLSYFQTHYFMYIFDFLLHISPKAVLELKMTSITRPFQQALDECEINSIAVIIKNTSFGDATWEWRSMSLFGGKLSQRPHISEIHCYSTCCDFGKKGITKKVIAERKIRGIYAPHCCFTDWQNEQCMSMCDFAWDFLMHANPCSFLHD